APPRCHDPRRQSPARADRLQRRDASRRGAQRARRVPRPGTVVRVAAERRGPLAARGTRGRGVQPSVRGHAGNMKTHYDALIVGAGVAGATAAILLARAGWSVAVLEKREFPRRKVCGECIAATNLDLLDALGVGEACAALAGPPLDRVGLYVGDAELCAGLPKLDGSAHPWGRALGREHLDTLLLRRAADLGATVCQPLAVRQVARGGGTYLCSATPSHGTAVT